MASMAVSALGESERCTAATLSPPPEQPTRWCHHAHVSVVVGATAGTCRHWRGISFPGTSVLVLPRVSDITQKHDHGNDRTDHKDCLLFEHCRDWVCSEGDRVVTGQYRQWEGRLCVLNVVGWRWSVELWLLYSMCQVVQVQES